jgi:hypothetical protein
VPKRPMSAHGGRRAGPRTVIGTGSRPAEICSASGRRRRPALLGRIAERPPRGCRRPAGALGDHDDGERHARRPAAERLITRSRSYDPAGDDAWRRWPARRWRSSRRRPDSQIMIRSWLAWCSSWSSAGDPRPRWRSDRGRASRSLSRSGDADDRTFVAERLGCPWCRRRPPRGPEIEAACRLQSARRRRSRAVGQFDRKGRRLPRLDEPRMRAGSRPATSERSSASGGGRPSAVSMPTVPAVDVARRLVTARWPR